uniref:Uncharacterized protein n=1 Tax=Arundo donax TaxID=35708 RepID=A0A0A9BNJ8_ARUDO
MARKERAMTTSLMRGRRAWCSCRHMPAKPTAWFSSVAAGPCIAITSRGSTSSCWNLLGDELQQRHPEAVHVRLGAELPCPQVLRRAVPVRAHHPR